MTWRNRAVNLYIVGMMGAGKSTLGRALAQELDRPFVDTDEQIERETGQTIEEIFRERGEAGFRDVETACLLDVSRGQGLVIALGGGGVLREENRRVIRATGRSIYLRARPETIVARLPEHPVRPILLGAELEERLELLRRLLALREPYYRQSDLVVDNEGPLEETLGTILRELRRRGWT
jgi:shikimate kinase